VKTESNCLNFKVIVIFEFGDGRGIQVARTGCTGMDGEGIIVYVVGCGGVGTLSPCNSV